MGSVQPAGTGGPGQGAGQELGGIQGERELDLLDTCTRACENALTAPHTCTNHAHMQTLYRARLKGVQKHLPRTAVAAAAPQSGPAPAFPKVSRVDAQFVSLSQASRVDMGRCGHGNTNSVKRSQGMHEDSGLTVFVQSWAECRTGFECASESSARAYRPVQSS